MNLIIRCIDLAVWYKYEIAIAVVTLTLCTLSFLYDGIWG